MIYIYIYIIYIKKRANSDGMYAAASAFDFRQIWSSLTTVLLLEDPSVLCYFTSKWPAFTHSYTHADTQNTLAQMEARASGHQEQCPSVAWRWETVWIRSPRLTLWKWDIRWRKQLDTKNRGRPGKRAPDWVPGLLMFAQLNSVIQYIAHIQKHTLPFSLWQWNENLIGSSK